jgi:hypothetical protein
MKFNMAKLLPAFTAMALLPWQAGSIILGLGAIVFIRLIYKYLRFVEIIIAVLVLAQLASYLIPRFTSIISNFLEGTSAPQSEAPGSSTLGSNVFEPSKPSRRQEEIQMHLRRLDIAAGSTPSSSYVGVVGSNMGWIPPPSEEVIHRIPSFDGNQVGFDASPSAPLFEANQIGLERRPSAPRRRQGEDIQMHLQRLAMAAAESPS